MELEEEIESLHRYAKKMFGIGLRDMWITKHSTCCDSDYFALKINVDMPADVLKKYERQIKKHYEKIARIMGVDIHTHIVPYRKPIAGEIKPKANAQWLYKRPDYFKV